jgi:hypothetical protein
VSIAVPHGWWGNREAVLERIEEYTQKKIRNAI